MKKLKDLDVKSLNDTIQIGKKILELTYLLLIMGLIGGVIYLGRETMIFSFLISIIDILMPLFIGFIIAWLFSPLVDSMQKKGIPRGLGTLVVYLVIFLIGGVFIWLFVPVIIDQISQFLVFMPSILAGITDFADGIFNSLSAYGFDVTSVRNSLVSTINSFYNDLSASIPKSTVNIASSLFSGIVDFALSLILGIYILIDFDNITNTMIKFVPTKHQLGTMKLVDSIGKEVRKTVNGILLIASMVFVCDTIGFAIIGLEAALLIGLFCGITDLIPYIGPYIGGGVAVIVGFAQGPIIGLGVLIIALLVQAIENYILQPVVMSKATNIHPIIIMSSLLIFGYFFGIAGMVLSTPILSILKVISSHFEEKYQVFSK